MAFTRSGLQSSPQATSWCWGKWSNHRNIQNIQFVGQLALPHHVLIEGCKPLLRIDIEPKVTFLRRQGGNNKEGCFIFMGF
jgi:hypothetical protein